MEAYNHSLTTSKSPFSTNTTDDEEKASFSSLPSVDRGQNKVEQRLVDTRKVVALENTARTSDRANSDRITSKEEDIGISDWEGMSTEEKKEALIDMKFFTKKDLRTKNKDATECQYHFEQGEVDRKQAFIPNEDVFLIEHYYKKYDIHIFLLEGEDFLADCLERLVANAVDCRLAFIFKTTPREGVDPSVYAMHYVPVIFDKSNGVCSLYILDSGYNHTSSGMKVPFENKMCFFREESVYFTGVSLQSDTASCGNSAWAIAKEALRCTKPMTELVSPLTDDLLMKIDGSIPSEKFYPDGFQRVYPVGTLAKYTQRTKVIDMMKFHGGFETHVVTKKSDEETLGGYLNKKQQPRALATETYRISEGKDQEKISEQPDFKKYMQLHDKGEGNLTRTINVIDREFSSGSYKNLTEMTAGLGEQQRQRLEALLKGDKR